MVYFPSSLDLEITDWGKCGFGASGITLVGLIAGICLVVLPLDKTIQDMLIGGFGGLARDFEWRGHLS